MRRHPFLPLAALVAMISACGSTARVADEPPRGMLAYDLTLRVDPSTETVEASAKLSPLAGPLTIQFAEQYAFARMDPRLVGPLRAVGPKDEPLALTAVNAHRWRLDPGDATACTLRWTVILDHRTRPEVVASSDQYEQPYVATDHGLLVTGAIVPMLDHPAVDPRVRLELPEGWDTIVPWPRVEPGMWAPRPDDLRNDLVAIGAWTRIDGEAGGLDYAIALAPGQEPLAAIVADRVPRVVEAEVEIFGSAPQKRYAFVFGRPDSRVGYGGSPKANGMALFVSPDLPLEFARDGVTHLIAHEYFHTWMKVRCRPEDELRFVVEGFTDYYAYLVPWRLGLLDDVAFLAALEEKLAEGAAALDRYGASLARAGGPEFFAGGDAYGACYAAGLGVALWTDLALRERGSDLDGFMRRFYEDPKWSTERRPSLADWLALLEAELGAQLAAAQLAAVKDPGGIDWTAFFGSIDVPLEVAVVPLDPSPRANFQGTTVTALDPAGAGAASGIRTGDCLLAVNGVDVTDVAGVRSAWRATAGGRLQVLLERGKERIEIDVEAPVATQFTLPPHSLEWLGARGR